MSLGELLNECVGVVMSIGLLLIVASCLAPIAWLFKAMGRRKKRQSQGLGTQEVISLILVMVLLAIFLANGTVSAMISSLLSK